jgi:hypothetical protein
MVAGVPGLGGATWAVLQWVLGLRELGHDVLLMEPVERLTTASVRQFEALRRGLLGPRAALVDADRRTVGVAYDDIRSFCRRADLLLDVAGMLVAHPALFGPVPVRAYLDLDPTFTQVWHDVEGIDMRLDGHTHFVTVGLNVGRPGCAVPTCGRHWITTLPPVVLSRWPVADRVRTDAFTTVAQWRGYGAVEHDGVRYGQRAHSWRPLFELPRRSPMPLAPALAISPGDGKDAAALEEHGWRLLDPATVASTADDYRAFVRGSHGELCVAKEGYVASRSGWFSDRSACYLASGRPVVAQDTGWSQHLPTGDGLFAFDDMDGALSALEAIAADPDRYGRMARRRAEQFLAADRVLPALLDTLGCTGR